MQYLHPKAKWLFFWKLVFSSLFLTALVILLFAAYIPPLFKTTLPQVVRAVFVFYLFIIGISLIVSYFWAELTYQNYKYEVAENTLKIECGVIWKKYVSIPYDRIQNIDIYRGLLDRLLGLSDLHVQTAGISGYTITEGHIPGLDPSVAEKLREELINLAKRTTKQGL